MSLLSILLVLCILYMCGVAYIMYHMISDFCCHLYAFCTVPLKVLYCGSDVNAIWKWGFWSNLSHMCLYYVSGQSLGEEETLNWPDFVSYNPSVYCILLPSLL